jgi:hypothetical protein
MVWSLESGMDEIYLRIFGNKGGMLHAKERCERK